MAALDRTVGTNNEAPNGLGAYCLGMSVSPGKLVYVAGQVGVDFDGRGEVYPHMYPDGDFPPSTLLVVAGLVSEDYLVEIKAVAALP